MRTVCLEDSFTQGYGVKRNENWVHQAFHYEMTPVVCICPPFDPAAARVGWSEFTDFDLVKERYLALRDWLLDFCRDYDLLCVDFYGEFEKVLSQNPEKDFYIDGIHLTAEGHEKIVDIVLAALDNF